jgi:hypothetical protein
MKLLLRSKPDAAAMGLVIALIALPVPKSNLLMAYSTWFHSRLPSRGSVRLIAQDAETGENEVSTDEVEKYVAVYKAMQRNRSMTVDQAAAAQGLTTRQFRELENRVQHDDAALQQARDELQAAARGAPAARGSTPIQP